MHRFHAAALFGSLAGLLLVACGASGERVHPEAKAERPVITPPVDAGAPVVDAAARAVCRGKLTEELEVELAARVVLSRPCFNALLANDPWRGGSMHLKFRFDAAGKYSGLTVVRDDIRDETFTACVLEKMVKRLSNPPVGGCIDVLVPINYVSDVDAGPRADASAPAP